MEGRAGSDTCRARALCWDRSRPAWGWVGCSRAHPLWTALPLSSQPGALTAAAGNEAHFLTFPLHQFLPSGRLYCSLTGRGQKSYSVSVSWTQGSGEVVGLRGAGLPSARHPQAVASVPASSGCAAQRQWLLFLPRLPAPSSCPWISHTVRCFCVEALPTVLTLGPPVSAETHSLMSVAQDNAAEGSVGFRRCHHSQHREEPRHSGIAHVTTEPTPELRAYCLDACVCFVLTQRIVKKIPRRL